MSPQTRAWLELFRVPNLLTVPGDPLAGACLAAVGAGALPPPGRLAMAAGASVCIYMAGLVLNDVADLAEDRQSRPGRPLPSGGISVAFAKSAGFWLTLAGVGLAFASSRPAGWVGVMLASAVLAYNFGVKHGFMGPLAMGGCRGLSLLLGAAAVGTMTPVVGAAAFALTIYVATFSLVARRETSGERPGAVRSYAPGGVMFVAIMALATWTAARTGLHGAWIGVIATGGVAIGLAWFAARQVRSGGAIPAAVGQWIGALMLMQAAIIYASGVSFSIWLGLAIFATWPLNVLLRREIASS